MKIYFTFLFILLILSLGAADPPADCVPSQSVSQCKQIKCSGPNSFQNCQNKVSPYIGGNQCCDQKTVEAFGKIQKKKSKRQAYNFDNYPAAKWNKLIPYYLNFTIPTYATAIKTAINHIEMKTCVRFSASSTIPTEPYIVFQTSNEGCVSFVGKSGKIASPIFGDSKCFSNQGQMVYLIVQTLGLWHQSQRPDASQYVTVNRSNMDEIHWMDFNPIDQSYLNNYGLAYDYASITQYPAKIFSNNGKPTLVPKDARYTSTMGQKVELSFNDAKLLNYMYCKAECSNVPNCKNGGYVNYNNCTSCICPLGYQEPYCDKISTPAKQVYSPNDCGGELFATNNEQTIMSPGYGVRNYETIMTCKWKISVPANSKVSLKFVESFGIYSDDYDACQDWVEIRYDKPANETGQRFCGSNLPTDALSSTLPEILVIFQSNDPAALFQARTGFKLQFKIESTSVVGFCSMVDCQNNGTCVETGKGFKCLCQPNYAGNYCEIDLGTSDNPCDAKPCHNNGTCVVDGSGSFKCLCQSGFSGNQCRNNSRCGGCDNPPGNQCGSDKPCVVMSKNCTGQSQGNSRSRWWIHERERSNPTDGCVQYQFCCDNAVEVKSRCLALGWTDWSYCGLDCKQNRYMYGMKDGNYEIVNSENKTCSGGFCNYNWWNWKFWGWFDDRDDHDRRH